MKLLTSIQSPASQRTVHFWTIMPRILSPSDGSIYHNFTTEHFKSMPSGVVYFKIM